MSGTSPLPACGAGAAWTPDTMAWVLAVLALGIVSVLVALGRGRPFPGRPWLVGVQACAAAWLLLAALAAAAEPACQRSLAGLQRPAMLGVAGLWLAFIVQYAGSRLGALPRWCTALAIVPLVAFTAMALTDGLHGLFLGRWVVNEQGVGAHEFGLGSFAGRIWAYGMLGGSIAIIVHRAWSATGRDRAIWMGFGVACLVPWLVLLAHQTWGWAVAGRDPTPLGLVSLLAVFVMLARGRRAFDLAPHASRILFTELGDALVVVDAELRVIERNPAARNLSVTPCHADAPLQDWTPWGPLLVPMCRGVASSEMLAAPGQSRRIQAAVHPLQTGSTLLGHLVHLHDVTDIAQAREALAEALRVREDALQALQARQAQLVDASQRDPLTGLLNRRALHDRFAEEATHTAHTGQPLCLAMIDIDHFKRVNDTHGHAAGDEVLTLLARHLTDGVRSGDAVFRIGGEEFVVLLPGADLARAQRRLDMLRESFAATPMLPGADTPITFSAGLVHVVGGAEALEAALKLADEALYRAKHDGRNCIRLAPENRPAVPVPLAPLAP